MSDAFSRLRLPLLLCSLALLVGGSKLDSIRPLEGQIVALVIPLFAVFSGVGPFADAHSALGMVAALVFEVLGAQRGLRSRLSAWFGLAIVFSLYFPAHAVLNNLFGSVFAAFFIALFLGGGAGLCLGEFAVRRARARA